MLPPETGQADDVTRLSATPIPGFGRHRLARCANSAPAILVASRDQLHCNYAAPVVLEHLAIQYDTECRILQPTGMSERGIFTLITCVDPDPQLRSYFLRIAGVVIEAVGDNPSRLEISRTMDALIDLFRALAVPPRKSVQGLWAELFVIARSREPERLARAWHATPGDTFDFAEGGERVEVKSAAGPLRAHHFSLAQLRSIPATQVLIVSMFVARVGAGESVQDLLAALRARLDGNPQTILRLESIVAATLGNTLRRALGETFDRQLAESSRAFYRAGDVPSIADPFDPRVSDIHFVADLTSVLGIELTEIPSDGLRAAVRETQ